MLRPSLTPSGAAALPAENEDTPPKPRRLFMLPQLVDPNLRRNASHPALSESSAGCPSISTPWRARSLIAVTLVLASLGVTLVAVPPSHLPAVLRRMHRNHAEQELPSISRHDNARRLFGQGIDSNGEESSLFSLNLGNSISSSQPYDYEALAIAWAKVGGRHNARNDGMQQLEFDIRVTSRNRTLSFRRLLDSLIAADYGGDIVNLNFMLDRCNPYEDRVRIRDMAAELEWPHGSRTLIMRHNLVHDRINHFEAFNPVGKLSIGLIVEEDVELSPLFYLFALNALHRYYLEQWDPNLAGLCLVPSPPPGVSTRVEGFYKSNSPCKKAAVLLPDQWRGFTEFATANMASNFGKRKWQWAKDNITGDWSQWWKVYLKATGQYVLHYNYYSVGEPSSGGAGTTGALLGFARHHGDTSLDSGEDGEVEGEPQGVVASEGTTSSTQSQTPVYLETAVRDRYLTLKKLTQLPYFAAPEEPESNDTDGAGTEGAAAAA